LVVAGERFIKDPDEAAQTHGRQIVDFATRNQLVPDGKRIEKTRTKWGELRIRLLNRNLERIATNALGPRWRRAVGARRLYRPS